MKFAMYKGERSISELVSRLFKFTGPGARAKIEEAEAALLEANEILQDLKHVPEGTLIVLPEIAGAKVSEEARPIDFAVEGMLEEVRRALGSARKSLEASTASYEAEAKRSLDIVKARELKVVAQKNPELKSQLSKITQENKERVKEAKALRDLQDQVFDQIGEDLDNVVKRFAGRKYNSD